MKKRIRNNMCTDLKEYLSDCRKGNHDLIEIYRKYGIPEDVVKWCRLCGSVVIDEETSDNRLYPGQGMYIMGPLLLGKIL
jgi:hypothetical protein